MVVFAGPLLAATGESEPVEDRRSKHQQHFTNAEAEAAQMLAARRAQASPIRYFAPFYSIENGGDTVLFLLNRTSDPVVVDVGAWSGGQELALGSFPIQPHRHVEVSLRYALEGLERGFETGFVQLSALGDPESLQGWAVLSNVAGETFEIPFQTPGAASTRDFYAFWDLGSSGARGREGVSFSLLNVSEHELSVGLTSSAQPQDTPSSLRLQPGEAANWNGAGGAALGRQGSLRLSHNGNPGDLLGVGLITGKGPVGAIPLAPRGEAEYQRRYESLPIDVESTEEASARTPIAGRISILNLAKDRQKILIEALDADFGTVVGHVSLEADPLEVLSTPLRQLVARSGPGPERLRFRVTGEDRGLLVQGRHSFRDGTAAELAFFSAYHGHGSAIYPLPDSRRFDITSSVLNVGEESSEIVGQVYWDGGTFSFGPWSLAPGASREIDLDQMAQNKPKDMMGRSLDSYRPNAVLQWIVHSGSTQLIGRTFVRPRGAMDRFGFNCFGCCHQFPAAVVVPGAVEFFTGQTPGFETAVSYMTCSGSMGPYPSGFSSLTVPWPFSWNGENVGATAEAEDTLSFETSATKITIGCDQQIVTIWGFGDADSCKTYLMRPDDPSKSWDPGQTCSSQTGNCSLCHNCCNSILAFNLCKGVNSDLAQSEANTCKGHCLTDVC